MGARPYRRHGRACWRHCAMIQNVKAALADGAVLAVVPLVSKSGKRVRP